MFIRPGIDCCPHPLEYPHGISPTKRCERTSWTSEVEYPAEEFGEIGKMVDIFPASNG
jgi:hypothetical protein